MCNQIKQETRLLYIVENPWWSWAGLDSVTWDELACLSGRTSGPTLREKSGLARDTIRSTQPAPYQFIRSNLFHAYWTNLPSTILKFRNLCKKTVSLNTKDWLIWFNVFGCVVIFLLLVLNYKNLFKFEGSWLNCNFWHWFWICRILMEI